MSENTTSVTSEVVLSIRNAESLEEAVEIFKNATTPTRRTNVPPTIDEVLDFARDRAMKDGEDATYYMMQAEKAFDFYSTNMDIMGGRTWKDGSNQPVKNWKLKIHNNWLRAR